MNLLPSLSDQSIPISNASSKSLYMEYISYSKQNKQTYERKNERTNIEELTLLPSE